MILTDIKKEIITNMNKLITEDTFLKEHTISIYSMGSFTKKEKFNDIDINIFSNTSDSRYLKRLIVFKQEVASLFEKEVHINLIDKEMWQNGLLTSNLFIHKNRHALLLYELKTLNHLLFGRDILREVYFTIQDLKEEILKLSLTIRHQLTKQFMYEGLKDYEVFYRKNCKYLIEFFSIYFGITNPYYLDSREFLKYFPHLLNHKGAINFSFSSEKTLTRELFFECYDMVLALSNLIYNDFFKSLKKGELFVGN
jgi:hypothetical protein